jgi:hypothetical protein
MPDCPPFCALRSSSSTVTLPARATSSWGPSRAPDVVPLYWLGAAIVATSASRWAPLPWVFPPKLPPLLTSPLFTSAPGTSHHLRWQPQFTADPGTLLSHDASATPPLHHRLGVSPPVPPFPTFPPFRAWATPAGASTPCRLAGRRRSRHCRGPVRSDHPVRAPLRVDRPAGPPFGLGLFPAQQWARGLKSFFIF